MTVASAQTNPTITERGSEPWELALSRAHDAQMRARAEARQRGNPLCPAKDPPDPIDPDPVVALCRRYAHRFQHDVKRQHRHF